MRNKTNKKIGFENKIDWDVEYHIHKFKSRKAKQAKLSNHDVEK